MANAPKTNSPAKKESGNSGNLFASLAIVICFVIGYLIWEFVMGNPPNFIDGDRANQPLPGNYAGMVYHAGVVGPILRGLFLMVFVFASERFIVINKASGTGNVGTFVREVQSLLITGSIDTAIAECDKQK